MDKQVFIATQFLKNMLNYPIPSIAEVMNLYDSLNNGASGIQLSEETAIGSFPKESVAFVLEMAKMLRQDKISD